MHSDLLFELGTEELPSAGVKQLAQALAENVKALLLEAKLSHGEVSFFSTPRRLAVLIYDLELAQASQQVVRRGPSVAISNETVLQGFAKSCGVSVDKLSTIKTDKGEWWAYDAISQGVRTADLLPDLISKALAMLAIAKPMRWGSGDVEFARPLHWVVLLLGDEVIKASILGVESGRNSFGHRYHHPQAVKVTTPRQYESLLNNAQVVCCFATRRQQIVDQISALASGVNAIPVMPDELLDEVTSIVESPHALLVHFEPEFLDVPAEALIAAMQSHQKCFALRDPQGALLPMFITVSNINSRNSMQVIAGNENVMRARLSDAAFFFNQDKKKRLCDYEDRLSTVVFQKNLGSLGDKVKRMESLMLSLAPQFNVQDVEAQRAAQLSKCDLMTGMVGEFPELQGLMGYYYAQADGEGEAVAIALNEQYMPRFSGDEAPKSNLGRALSLAERLDTLVGAFACGQKPTGVKDPFKLRRHALAVARILLTSPIDLNLSSLIAKTRKTYGDTLPEVPHALDDLQPFILDRLQSFYQAQGVHLDLIQAVRALESDCLLDMDKRLQALQTFIQLPEALALSAACKRVNNLLQQSSQLLLIEKQGVNPMLLTDAAEKALFNEIQRVEQAISEDYEAKAYGAILTTLASLREPLDVFFEHVMVMVDDVAIKTNRLMLLARLQTLLQGVADISRIQRGL